MMKKKKYNRSDSYINTNNDIYGNDRFAISVILQCKN